MQFEWFLIIQGILFMLMSALELAVAIVLKVALQQNLPYFLAKTFLQTRCVDVQGFCISGNKMQVTNKMENPR